MFRRNKYKTCSPETRLELFIDNNYDLNILRQNGIEVVADLFNDQKIDQIECDTTNKFLLPALISECKDLRLEITKAQPDIINKIPSTEHDPNKTLEAVATCIMSDKALPSAAPELTAWAQRYLQAEDKGSVPPPDILEMNRR